MLRRLWSALRRPFLRIPRRADCMLMDLSGCGGSRRVEIAVVMVGRDGTSEPQRCYTDAFGGAPLRVWARCEDRRALHADFFVDGQFAGRTDKRSLDGRGPLGWWEITLRPGACPNPGAVTIWTHGDPARGGER